MDSRVCCLEVMEKRMETTIVYWGHIGIMEKKMEAILGFVRYVLCPCLAHRYAQLEVPDLSGVSPGIWPETS